MGVLSAMLGQCAAAVTFFLFVCFSTHEKNKNNNLKQFQLHHVQNYTCKADPVKRCFYSSPIGFNYCSNNIEEIW